jgi:hypothetical protein
MRNTHLNIEPDTLLKIELVTGRDDMHQAIGYLSQWASSSAQYAYAELIGHASADSVEITATYRADPLGPITYQIGAVWHPDSARADESNGHFGFHS